MVEENKKLGKYPDMKCRIESAFHFPQAGSGGQQPRLVFNKFKDF